MERKRKISADLPPDRDSDDDIVGPMPAQVQTKPETKKRKGMFGGKYKSGHSK